MAEKINILVLEDDETRITHFRERFHSLFLVGENTGKHMSEICYARTAQDAIEFLKETAHFDIIFLDHDLGDRVFVSSDDENTGSEVVRYLVEHSNEYSNTRFIIHSFNPIGAESMFNSIREHIHRDVQCIPGIWTKDIFNSHIRIK